MGAGASSKQQKGAFKDSYMVSPTELGTGAFSVVKLAVKLKTSEKVAVKIIKKKKLVEDEYASLMQEIEILRALKHDHVIRLHDYFEEPLECMIVTELASGGELFDRIVNKSKYTEKEARDVIKIIVSTLAYIHEQGVVHRDLKPENLLLCSLDNDSDLKFADFGFAKYIKDLKDEAPCGTPGYVAPEIIKRKPYGVEVDVWSMGVICYVLLCGYPPFYDENQAKLFKKIKEGRFHFHEAYWAHISTEAIDMIKCMLKVEQKDRWTANALLSHPWLIMGDEKLSSRDLSSSITVMKKFNGKRRLKAAADAIILSNRMKAMGAGASAKIANPGAIDMKNLIESESVILDEEKVPQDPEYLNDTEATKS